MNLEWVDALTVDIRGTATTNKGSQLMLEAIVERIGDKVDLSAPPQSLDYAVRARFGMYQTLHLHRFPRCSALVGNCLPAELRSRYGLVADREITAVLDASGFAYTDSLGPIAARHEALYGRSWRRRGLPKVMLPQAYGPFHGDVARWTTEALNQASIIFVRDMTSLQHLRELSLHVPVEVAPDFTIGLAAVHTPVPVEGAYVAIVPNMRLVTHGKLSEGEYVDHFVALGQAAAGLGLSPLVVIHETADRRICSLIAQQLGASTFDDPRPLVLKGAIAGASLLIASRFHAVVGGLSQSVRTVAIGWSHKYAALLADFGVPGWLAEIDADPRETVKRVMNDDDGAARLHDARLILLDQVESMWQTTEQILGVCAPENVPSPAAPPRLG